MPMGLYQHQAGNNEGEHVASSSVGKWYKFIEVVLGDANCVLHTVCYQSVVELCQRAMLVLLAGAHETVPAAEHERRRAGLRVGHPREALEETCGKA